MLKALWGIIGTNPGSIAIFALVVIVSLGSASGVGAYFMHKIDNGKYVTLELKYSQAQSKAKDDQIKAQAKFDNDLAAANARAAALQSQLEAERAKHAQSLHDALTAEGAKNVPLNICLHTKLPDGILRNLAR